MPGTRESRGVEGFPGVKHLLESQEVRDVRGQKAKEVRQPVATPDSSELSGHHIKVIHVRSQGSPEKISGRVTSEHSKKCFFDVF